MTCLWCDVPWDKCGHTDSHYRSDHWLINECRYCGAWIKCEPVRLSLNWWMGRKGDLGCTKNPGETPSGRFDNGKPYYFHAPRQEPDEEEIAELRELLCL